MLPEPLLRLIRRLTLRARHRARGKLAGAYESAMRGAGLTFADVRPYQPGDDIRHVDWNVTARTGVPQIKRFIEERERIIWLAVDGSASLNFGGNRETQSKRHCAAEVAALIAFAAAAQSDRVGLIQFTDTPEHIIVPGKGDRHARRVVRALFTFRAHSQKTSIASALNVLRRRRRAVVFLISDFLDTDCSASLRVAASKHDLVAVTVRDPAEESLPAAGLVQFTDSETGSEVLINTGNPRIRAQYAAAAKSGREAINEMLRSTGADRIDISTSGGHLEALLAFFQRREHRR